MKSKGVLNNLQYYELTSAKALFGSYNTGDIPKVTTIDVTGLNTDKIWTMESIFLIAKN